MPTAPGPPPLLNTPAEQLQEWRRRLLGLTCVAGLGGLPQVSARWGRGATGWGWRGCHGWQQGGVVHVAIPATRPAAGCSKQVAMLCM